MWWMIDILYWRQSRIIIIKTLIDYYRAVSLKLVSFGCAETLRFCREIGSLECVENRHKSQADQKQGHARTVTRVVDDS